MRYRRYYVDDKQDGSYRVVSHGPYVGFLRPLAAFLGLGLYLNREKQTKPS
jgi:hypothetical protein